MTWQQLITEAKKYSTIYVTGCQRTGTTFCAHALANEIKYTHIDEKVFNADDLDLFNSIPKYNTVIQCPALFHLFPKLTTSGLILYIDRDEKDVVASMNKSGWLEKYRVSESRKFSNKVIDPYGLKLAHYLCIKSAQNVVSIPYEELVNAKGYLPKEKRTGFNIKQIA